MALQIGSWCISQSEDRFSLSGYASRESAIAEGTSCYGGASFYIGQVAHPLDTVKPDVNLLLENLDERIWDACGGDDQTISLSVDNTNELRKVIEEFLRDKAKFHWYLMDNVEQFIPSNEEQPNAAKTAK